MILIYSPKTSERLNYILKYIFNDILGSDFQLTDDTAKFNTWNSYKLNYSNKNLDCKINIEPVELLFETDILQKEIEVSEWKNLKVFFRTSEESDIPFDIFAATFYLISRYEEYLPFSADQHGRFEANQSLACKNGFLYDPIIDQWACKLSVVLKNAYPDFKICHREFKYLSTIDIDNAYAYLYKGTVRTLGAAMRDLIKMNGDETKKRFETLKGEKDPFDTYGYLNDIHEKYRISPIWFFLVGNYSTYDKNLPLDNQAFQDLIREISQNAEVGIHPSYESNKDFKQLKKEYDYIQEVTGKPITKSRQHYLKLMVNETYRNLIKLGVKEDYTMGYATDVGFRAGTCTPFNFYDLYAEKETDLKIYPFQVMDATLNQNLKLNVDEAIEKVFMLINKVKEVKGTFVSLWHNESLSDHGNWKGWEPVYKKMFELIFNK